MTDPIRHIITAPAGSGKTTAAIHAIVEEKRRNPLGTVWVLLPTNLQVGAFRNCLLETFGDEVYFGIQFYNFYDLYTHLLDRLHIPKREIDQAAVYRVMRHLLNDPTLRSRLLYFTPIIDTAGFMDVVVQFIFELKQAHIPPDVFHAYARTRSDKDFDIALIYEAYQIFLRKNDLVDREGAGWLALAELEKPNTALHDVSLLVVDGFTQFSPLQARLLNDLTDDIPHTILTLTHETQRATTIHRSFERTLQRILSYGREWISHPLGTQNPGQHPALVYLEEHFMSASGEPDPIPAHDALSLLEAPDSESEVRMVLREVKRRLLAGVAPDDMVILARDMQPYADMLRSVAHRYSVPMLFREGLALNRNPAIAALLELLHLADPRRVNFKRLAVMDLLRSPYFRIPFTPEDVNALERISLRYKIINGRQKWLDAIDHALHEQEKAQELLLDFEDANDPTNLPLISDDLYVKLRNFFDRITPPHMAMPHEFVAWIEGVMGVDPLFSEEDIPDSLSFLAQIREEVRLGDTSIYSASQAVISRDLHAVRQLQHCLRDILSAYELVESEPLAWQSFLVDLERALKYYQTETFGVQNRSGHVLATTVFEARGLPHPHVFIMGLSEGRFPAPRNEDPLYSDRERAAMQQAGLQVILSTQEEDDTSIFYTCAAMAQQHLTLSRTTIDEKANVWSPSVLWEATVALLKTNPPKRLSAGIPQELGDVADEREWLVSLAHTLNQTELDAVVQGQLAGLLTEIAQHPTWNNVLLAREVEARRRNVFDTYSGVLEDETLQARVAEELDSERIWSASQFNDYGYCPFRFFAKRLLRLEKFEEPSEGLDALQLGSLQHEILEYTYHYFMTAQFAIVPENLERALNILYSKAEEVFADAPFRLRFRASAIWAMEKQEIVERLVDFVKQDFGGGVDDWRADLGIQGQEPRYVYAVESPFGLPNERNVYFPPAKIEGAAGSLLTLGLIDRIDHVGDELFIIDYKSGSQPPDAREIESARNFQMMVYLLAAEQLVAQTEPNLRVQAGVFISLRDLDNKVIIRMENEHLETARQRLHEYILAARQGDFRVQPNRMEDGKCYKHCEYYQFCRVVRSDMHKT